MMNAEMDISILGYRPALIVDLCATAYWGILKGRVISSHKKSLTWWMFTEQLDPLMGFPAVCAAGCLCCSQFARPIGCSWERLEVVPDHGGQDMS